MKIIYYLILFTIFACKSEQKDPIIQFYTIKKNDNDLYRLPLIYPYEINSARGLKYFAIFGTRKLSNDFTIEGNVDSVNVIDSTIIFFGDLKYNYDNCDYIIISNMKNIYPLNKQNYRKVKDSLNINVELIGVYNVYNNWCEQKKLPWWENSNVSD